MAYTGVMGSGKTYEAVSTAALNALRSGRRVVTNISGFNFERIRDFLGPLKSGELLQPDRVVVVPSIRITEPYFFFDPEAESESVVRPGDLVLVDEVWAFWGTDKKLTPEHQKFFRMHRHYIEAGTGTACDLVVMIQDLSSLHRFIKGVLETSFKFTKMKTLGLSSAYRVEVYEGSKQTKATLVSAQVKRYDKKVFPLYQSYEGGAGKERVVDDRQNLLKNKWFLASVLGAVAGLVWSGTWFAGWVSRAKAGGAAPGQVQPVAQSAPLSASAPGLARPQIQKDGRLVAVAQLSTGETLVVLELEDGRFIRKVMSGGVIDGWQSFAAHDGRVVAFQFGGKSK